MMNIYVIIGQGYTKEQVIREIKEEGYDHNFLFGQDVRSDRAYQMMVSDEIWTFGDVTKAKDYHYALDKGYDLWIMG